MALTSVFDRHAQQTTIPATRSRVLMLNEGVVPLDDLSVGTFRRDWQTRRGLDVATVRRRS